MFFLIALNALSTISELHIQNKLNAISLQKSRKEGRGLAGVFIIKYERLCSFINIRQFHVEQNLGPEILVGNSSFFSHLDRNAYIQNQHVILVQKTRRESMKYFCIL